MKKLFGLILIFVMVFSINIIARADDVEPLTITLTPDKSCINAGETITIEYSVTGGSGSYKTINYRWQTDSGGSTIYGSYVYVSGPNGIISYTPETGTKTKLWFYVQDSEGRSEGKFSEEIEIQGFDIVEPITITLTPDKSSINAGETITIEYSVTGGSGSYKTINYRWQTDSGGSTIYGSYVYVSGPNGIISYTPETGTKTKLWFYVQDSEGRSEGKFSEEIIINPIVIVLAPYPSVVYSGETVMIEPSINNGAEDTFSFLSSDTSVLTVDNSGLVSGVSPGQASVLIKAEGLNLTKTIDFSVVPFDSPEITATIGNPVRTTHYGASGKTEELSFTAEVTGGFAPYSYHYYLYRDGVMAAETETDTVVFKTSGDVITANGTYTAKVVVRDTAWQTTVAWSSGFYRQAAGSATVGTFGMAQPDFIIPQGTKVIGEEAFEGTKASVVKISDGCEQIGTRAFANSSISQVYIPPSCSISDDAFAGCGFLNIFGTKGSEAERFAIRNHERCRFIEVN